MTAAPARSWISTSRSRTPHVRWRTRQQQSGWTLGVGPRGHIPPGYAESSSMRRSRPPTARLRLRRIEGPSGRWTYLGAALGARAPTCSCFPASKVVPSFRAYSAARNRLLALGLCRPIVPGAGPPFPASSAFAAAAIPRSAVAAIPRCSAGGGRHPPDRVYGHHRRGARRTASSSHREGESGRSRTSAAAKRPDDGAAGRRADRGYQEGAAACGLRRAAAGSMAQRASRWR